MGDPDNQVFLRGRLLERDALRHTPAGVPIVAFRIGHESVQTEGGAPRKVGCEVGALAVDSEARLLAAAPLGTELRVSGFLDRRSRRSKQVVLHATRVEFLSETGSRAEASGCGTGDRDGNG